jgi:hypothetical protein
MTNSEPTRIATTPNAFAQRGMLVVDPWLRIGLASSPSIRSVNRTFDNGHGVRTPVNKQMDRNVR